MRFQRRVNRATGAREISIRHSMLANMLLVVGLFAIAVLITTVIGAQSIAKSLSATLIGQTIVQIEERVNNFIAPVDQVMGLMTHWVSREKFDTGTGDGSDDFAIPVMAENPQIHALLIVAPDRSAILITRLENAFRTRLIPPIANTAGQVRYTDRPTLQVDDYRIDIGSRPWFQAAMSEPDNARVWTDAYRFLEGGLPGMTASRRISTPTGDWVIAVDLLLEDISEFTRQFSIGTHGIMLITDRTGQVVGLPNIARYAVESRRREDYLKKPFDLGVTLATDAAMAFQPDPEGEVSLDPVQFRSDGETWWGQGRWISLDGVRELWAGVLVPERELLGAINRLRWLLVTITLLVTVLAIIRAIVLARRYSLPIRELAEQSLMISTGKLSEPPPIISPLKEVARLAGAHERMRRGLANLLKLEDDLKIAREIQQNTFPREFPELDGYRIGGSTIPADATGGDTWDVIGMSDRGGARQISNTDASHVNLLLADATGHGVGPALTAAQVHAMFRMASRLKRDLSAIAVEMNEQLLAETSGGRFVTAWMATLSVKDHQITMLSAGQAPILQFHAASREFTVHPADLPPLGVLSYRQLLDTRTLTMARGDVIAVFSDGVLEAENEQGEAFGLARIENLVRQHHLTQPTRLLELIQAAQLAFVGEHRFADDRTGIVITRFR